MTKKEITNSIERPPVVVVMGHIDHGKSTLLDYIRSSNVVEKEAGGITQHISAYEAVHKTKDDKTKKITFIDTPGHEAFSTMRSRGARVADIAVLVVSAEDGVKAQTLEAKKSIEEAGIPYIVAMNKIDKPNANIDKTKQTLAENEILVESYGGKIPDVAISAKTGAGVEDLLEVILLVSELEELKGEENRGAEGIVVEVNMDPKTGTLVTGIVKNGTLNEGDFVVVGKTIAKAKRIDNFLGEKIKKASFSSPVRILGFMETPSVGETFMSFKNKKEAETFADEQKDKSKEDTTSEVREIEIPILIKADVTGTLEAVEGELRKKENDKVSIKIVGKGLGPIGENDIKMVSAGVGPIILGFNVKVEKSAGELAERLEIDVQTFDIIYKMSEWLDELIKKRTPKEYVENISGRAKILKVFSKTKDKQVVGGKVTEGLFTKGKPVKIMRREVLLGKGKIVDLQQNKLPMKDVETGSLFGSMIEAKITIAEGDQIEVIG